MGYDNGNAYLHSGMYTFELGDADARTPVEARFSYVWRKVAGNWKISHHHSSVRPAGAKPAEPEVAATSGYKFMGSPALGCFISGSGFPGRRCLLLNSYWPWTGAQTNIAVFYYCIFGQELGLKGNSGVSVKVSSVALDFSAQLVWSFYNCFSPCLLQSLLPE